MTTNHRAPDPVTAPGVVERLEAIYADPNGRWREDSMNVVYNALPRLLAVVRAARDTEHNFALGWPKGAWEMSPKRITVLNALQDALAALDTEGEGPERRTKPEPVEWWHR